MKLIIAHYHLNPGGVTKIIESQIIGISDVSHDTEMILLCGNANKLSAIQGIAVKTDPLLDYSEPLSDESLSIIDVSEILDIFKGSGDKNTIFHFHNPNLGKNPAVTAAVYQLALAGFSVLNHTHDFPEDRPANMSRLEKQIPRLIQLPIREVLYPNFPHYHYAVLNTCDYHRILQQGIPPSRIHLLPNPVIASGFSRSTPDGRQKIRICKALGFDPGKKICTYPVRAIARKNLAEFLLIAALFMDQAQFAITQPPKNPAELPAYHRWKMFCIENDLGIKFEAGETVDYEELIYISDFCITTSIREGFGMVYLEPWLAGTPVIGRELTCIIDDLKKMGISFPRLYQSIWVVSKDGLKDFKDIGQEEQLTIIKSVIHEPQARLNIMINNPIIAALLEDIPADLIQRNQEVIKERFSIEKYGKELHAIYKEISR